MTRPGALRRRLTIWRDVGAGVDSLGQHEEDWQPIGNRSGSIEAAKGVEQFQQDAIRARQPVVIVIRWDQLTKLVGPADRLRYNDEDGVVIEYDIQSATDIGALHKYIRINALVRSPEANRLPAPA